MKRILVSALSYWDIFWPHCTTDGRIGKRGDSVYHLSPPLSFSFLALLTNMYCMCGWIHLGLFAEGRQWRMWAMSDGETVLCLHPLKYRMMMEATAAWLTSGAPFWRPDSSAQCQGPTAWRHTLMSSVSTMTLRLFSVVLFTTFSRWGKKVTWQRWGA